MTRPIHPQPLAGEPNALRWCVATGELPVGSVIVAPGPLAGLIERGILTHMLLERDAIVTWLAPGRSWRDAGAEVRETLGLAVEQPSWEAIPNDDSLRVVARDVVEAELGGFITSHGGAIAVEDVDDGVVTLSFGGACEHCPAAGFTLHARIEAAIRRRYPPLVGIERAHTDAASRGRRWLRLFV